MTNAKRSILAAVAGALSMGAVAAWADEATQQDQRIQELQTKIAALEAQQAANSKDMATTIDAMLRDSEKRSQLLATGGEMGAGYDNGFYIRAGDAWVLRPEIQFQFRNVTNYRENTAGAQSDQIENGFEVRRMRFDLAGNAFTKDLSYFFQWESPRNDGSLSLLEAWARYMFADDWGLRIGQIKDLTTHEWVMSTKRQLAVETSLMDSIIGGTGNGGYTKAANLIYGGYNKNNPINIEGGLTGGANQMNTDFRGRNISATNELPEPEPIQSYIGAPRPHTYDWGVAGRAEWKVMGNWSNYTDFTARETKQDLLVIGLGGDWSQGGDGDLFIATADAQYKNAQGLSLYGAVVARRLNDEQMENGHTGLLSSTTDWGVLLQAAYAISPVWEVFGRYDGTWMDQQVMGDEDAFHEITVGVNYYLGQNGSAGHRAKITVDLTYLPNGSPASFTGLGILDNNDADGEWMLRGQFQLLI